MVQLHEYLPFFDFFLGITNKVHLDKETLKKPGLCDNPNKTQILCITFWTSFLVFLYDGMQVRVYTILLLVCYYLLLVSVTPSNVSSHLLIFTPIL